MFTTIADVPTVGLYVGWFFAVVALAMIVGGALLIRSSRSTRDSFSSADRFTVGAITSGGGVLCALITLACMWPLKYEYHHYVSKSGTVESASKRLVGIGSDSGASERYIVKLVGDPFPYGIDDTRAALLKPGMHVGIKCKKEHQFFQPYNQNGWACRWGA